MKTPFLSRSERWLYAMLLTVLAGSMAVVLYDFTQFTPTSS